MESESMCEGRIGPIEAMQPLSELESTKIGNIGSAEEQPHLKARELKMPEMDQKSCLDILHHV